MLKGVGVPVVFHGFNKGPAVLEEICAGGYYVSFGAALLHPDSNAAKHMPFVPAGRYFLETDEAAQSIEDIYEAAAALRKCTVDDVILQIESNFHTVFKK
jgi:TatD DNase family protein